LLETFEGNRTEGLPNIGQNFTLLSLRLHGGSENGNLTKFNYPEISQLNGQGIEDLRLTSIHLKQGLGGIGDLKVFDHEPLTEDYDTILID
jgi:hypothetical protein